MRRSSRRNRRASQRGAVIVEYAFLLVAFAIPAAAGMVQGGIQLMTEYKVAKTKILSPTP